MNYLLIIGIVILFVVVGYYLITYNKFMSLNNMVNEAFSTMDVYLKKRWDLIPNIVAVVKGYAKHENETLKDIVSIRKDNYDTLDQNNKIDTNEKINRDIFNLMILVEDYPELKANESFLTLQKELSKIEDEIAQSRKYYNAVVRDFNNKVQMIPSNIVAKLLGYKTRKMFIADDNEREAVKVKLL